MNSKNTKRALVSSALAMLVCVAMLIGTTFAWFTDTASTGVNKITSGNLDVQIQDKAGKEIDTLEWVKEDGTVIADQDAILWEPGCTYLLIPFKIANVGNLALKYKIVVTGLEGDSILRDVIKFTYKTEDGNVFDMNAEGHLTAKGTDGAETKMITVSAHMDETAGNDYMNKELKNVKFTVYAAQDTVENDSYNNTYDKNAEYATPVATAAELSSAVAAGENVVLTSDVALNSALNITKSVSIDLNGKTVTSAQSFAQVMDGTLTLNGGTVKSGNVAVRAEENGKVVINDGSYSGTYAVYATKGGTVTVNGGEFVSQEFTCAVPNGGNVTINGGTFTAKDNAVVGTNGSSNFAPSTITINGGTFNGNIQSAGYIACGVYVANSDTVNINGGTFNITDGVGILMRAGNTTIGKNVVINLTNTGKVTEGKIGDATINITTPSYLVQDVRSGYPGATAGFTITNNSSYNLVSYDK